MLIYANLCSYPRQTDGRTDKHIKSIVRNLTIPENVMYKCLPKTHVFLWDRNVCSLNKGNDLLDTEIPSQYSLCVLSRLRGRRQAPVQLAGRAPLLRRRLMRGRRTRRAQLLLDRLDRAQQQIRPAPLPLPLLHLRLTLARADSRRDDVPRHLLPTIAERASLPRARRLLNAGDV